MELSSPSEVHVFYSNLVSKGNQVAKCLNICKELQYRVYVVASDYIETDVGKILFIQATNAPIVCMGYINENTI